MNDDLRDMLQRSAARPTRPFDGHEVRRLAARRHRRPRLIAATVSVVAVALIVGLGVRLLDSSTEPTPPSQQVAASDNAEPTAPNTTKPTPSKGPKTDGPGARQSTDTFNVVADSTLSTEELSLVRHFLEFALTPNAATAKPVRFSSHLTLRVNSGAPAVLTGDQLLTKSQWMLKTPDGGATASALFVVSNSIAQAHSSKVTFAASDTIGTDKCSTLLDKTPQFPGRRIVIQPRPDPYCGPRIDLYRNRRGEVSAVALSVMPL